MIKLLDFQKRHSLFDDNNYDSHILENIIDVIGGNQMEKYSGINQTEYNSPIFLYIGIYYEYEKKNSEKALEYYLISANNKNMHAYNNIGLIYRGREEYDKALLYFKMGIDHGSPCGTLNIGNLYRIQKKYDLAEKYLLMSLNANFNLAMLHLGVLYTEMKKYKLAETYYIMAINNGYTCAVTRLKDIISNEVKIYSILKKINNPKENIVNEINNLINSNTKISIIDNKLKTGSIQDECPICYEHETLIPTECKHFYCVDCYSELNKCALCRGYLFAPELFAKDPLK